MIALELDDFIKIVGVVSLTCGLICLLFFVWVIKVFHEIRKELSLYTNLYSPYEKIERKIWFGKDDN